jgi:hypothetical protein
MTVLTTVVMTALSVTFEMPQWKAPSTVVWLTILYNAVLIFGFAHAAWTFLARSLPPVASSLSVMMIPILGVFAGAIGLGEVLHWQDCAADLPPINRTAHFSKKSITLENDGHENKQIQRRADHWFSAAGRSRHADQGDRSQARLQ